MSLNSIFQYFVPKDKKLFTLFEKDSANLIVMARRLTEAVNTEDITRRNELFKEIENLEHVGDEITHQIHLELSKNFITPFDREDIHQLASAIDDIADYIHGSASRMFLYKVNVITQPIKELSELILQACQDLDKAIRELRDLKNIRNIADSCVRINSIENQADYVFDKAVGELFEYEKDAVNLIKYKEVLSALETATDMCEDAANVLESILVKHA
jgi:predicted phosphate transport protein (TIGR00153 family)